MKPGQFTTLPSAEVGFSCEWIPPLRSCVRGRAGQRGPGKLCSGSSLVVEGKQSHEGKIATWERKELVANQ